MQKIKNNKTNLTLITFFGVCLAFIFLNISYANMHQSEPNVIININSNGNCTSQGSLFGNEQLYPGKEIDGVIRITSGKHIAISSMRLNIDIVKHKKEYAKEKVYDSFTNSTSLSAKKGKGFLILTDYIFENINLSSFTSDEGFDLDNPLTITPGNPVDLLYTLSMNEEAGDELESVTTSISFIIRVEDTIYTIND